MNYINEALNFAKKYGITLKINSADYKHHFTDDSQKRYVFNCTLKCNGKQYTFNFGQSIAQGNNQPNIYDVFCCLQKYDVGTFDNFCSDYGYNNDSIKAHKTYKAVLREHKNMIRVFGAEILEAMQEIQ